MFYCFSKVFILKYNIYVWRGLNIEEERKIKIVNCLESRLHDNACSTDFTFPLARWEPMQPTTIDPILDLVCTRYPLWLGGPRQCGIRSLPNTLTHGQPWESNPRPSDLESNARFTGPHAPIDFGYARSFIMSCEE